MSRPFNPEMLNLARDLLGYSQTEVARMTGIHHADISKYESGLIPVPGEKLDLLAKALDMPVEFFFRPGYRHGLESGEIFHRKNSSARIGQLKRIYAMLDVFRLNLEILLQKVDVDLPYKIPEYSITELESTIEVVAASVRAYWGLPPGHVRNLTEVLENARCIIHAVDFGTDDIDEVTQWIEPLPPIMLVNSRASGDRLRFSMAHALGHLILHHGIPPYPAMEKEADLFAAAFLMPAQDIKSDFSKITLEKMLAMKPLWKVSIQALINRAYELNKINDTRRKSLYEMLSRKGWRKNEPFPLQIERPTLFPKLLSLYTDERHFSKSELAQLLNVNVLRLTRWYFPDELKTRMDNVLSLDEFKNKRSSG